MTQPWIAIEGLAKRFEARRVLDGISVGFPKGAVSALVGPSGGGKSTLLRCINGLETFDAGRVRVGPLELGAGATDRALLRAIRLRVGMVFQHYGLFAHMTALDNVLEAPVHVRKIPRPEALAKAESLLERVGLAHRRDAFPRELSGGEQQRVAIARALATEHEALLLDEPTSALDPDRKVEVLEVIRDLAKGGATMVIVTHEAALIRDIAGHAVCLRDGRIAAEGTPRDVLSS